MSKNDKTISGQKWFLSFCGSAVAILCFFAVFIFWFDPCFQFRIPKENLFFFERYVGPGLIENYEYDTYIIGTSRAANFDMELFREELGVDPLLTGMGGMGIKDLSKLIEKAQTIDRAKRYYICMDFPMFQKDWQLVPEYLYNDDVISRWKYMTSYEVWFRFIPVDIGGILMQKLDIDAPKSIMDKLNIDRYSNWSDYATSGKQTVIDNYIAEEWVFSEAEREEVCNTLKATVGDFIDGLNLDNAEYIFFFPPYSSLWWCDAENTGYAEIYYELKRFIVNKISDKGIIYDFQYAEITSDLDNYYDTGHYNQDVNDWMVEQFTNEQYVITIENMDEKIEALEKNTIEFRREYSWLWIK